MRCCSCWSMKTGALLVGIWNFVLPLLAAIPLVGYLVNTDVPGLNFIQENYQALLKGVSNFLKGHVWTKDMHEQILAVVENIFPTLVVVATVFTGLFVFSSFLMVIGLMCKRQCLMIFFLIICMIGIIVTATVGVVIVVAVFFLNTIPGTVSLVVYVILTVVFFFSWAVVLFAYKELASASGYDPVSTIKPSSGSAQHFVLKEYRQASLAAHNVCRAKHGVPPLSLNNKLNRLAQQWAEHLLSKSHLEHRPNNNNGENIFRCQKSWAPAPQAQEAVDSWYNEIRNYTFGREPGPGTGHFTQVVWKSSKEIGVGVALGKEGKVVVVANYSPAGNNGQYVENVLPLK